MVMLTTATILTSTGQDCLDEATTMAVTLLGTDPVKARELVGAAHAMLLSWKSVRRGISDLARSKRHRRDDRDDAVQESNPLMFRAAHHPLDADEPAVVASTNTIQDVDGGIGSPFRVIDTLSAFHSSGKITDGEYDVARNFEETFAVSGLDNLRASSFFRLPIGSGGVTSLSNTAVSARNTLWAIFEFFGGSGSPTSSALWHVVGLRMSIREFALRTQFGSKGSMSPRRASSILVDALQQLPSAPISRKIKLETMPIEVSIAMSERLSVQA